MKYSRLFGRTTRETPADAESASHQLLVRAGMISQGAAGVYSYLPLGWRVLRKIEQIVREEMDRAGGQELRMPALQPFELWEASGRYVSFGQTLFTVMDRKEHKLALGPTHEEVITDLARRYVQSYRDLPLMPYQLQTKFRDEPRPRGGLLRVREFIMKDMYSFDVDDDGLARTYETMAAAYAAAYRRLGLPAVMVEADSGAIGGKDSHEFMVLTASGEDVILHCDACGYAANAEKATFNKSLADSDAAHSESLGPVSEVATPDSRTIEEVAAFLGVPASGTLKAVFYIADGEFVLAVIRGDLEVNEIKLQRVLHCTQLRLAEEEETLAAGIVTGFASPVGLSGVKVIADDTVPGARDLVAGANKPGFHLRNVNYARDYEADVVADIALARDGDACPRCGLRLTGHRGIEVGHIFKLGTFLSTKLNAMFLDESGTARPCVMGCYGIGIGRLLAAIVEHSHDDKGIIWPAPVAPYQVHLCTLNPDKEGVEPTADSLYAALGDAGIEVLYDDRPASPGVKFNDADLLGLPFRVTVSPRTLANGCVEVKRRDEREAVLVSVDEAASRLTQLVRGVLAQQA